jgi:glyoxylase-like metal-dependent hydrolase (beta-lactamase superfamily II)
MKRILKIIALVVVVLVVALAALVAVTFMGRQSIIDGFEVNGIRIVSDGIVSMAVVPVGDGRVALVDAGNDATGKAISVELARRQLTPDAVAAIFVTHGHGDHIGGIAIFPKAQVMALEAEVALVEGREGAHGPVTRLFPVRPTGVKVSRALHDGETITIGDTQVRVFAVPGHTGGSAAYLINGVLFLGDAADTSSAGEMIGSPWIFSDSQARDRASLVRLAQRLDQEHADVKALVFAHSGVRTEGLAPLAAFAQKNP